MQLTSRPDLSSQDLQKQINFDEINRKLNVAVLEKDSLIKKLASAESQIDERDQELK